VIFLEFLDQRDRELGHCTQSDVDDWLADGPPSAHEVGDFLDWTAARKTTPRFSLPGRLRRGGPRTDDETRFALVRRLLVDESIEVTDRVAGCLVLLYGQQLSRIASLRRDQVVGEADGSIRLSLGTTPIQVPPPLDQLIGRLLDEHRHHSAFSLPTLPTPWLFPGLHPGRPFNTNQLGARLRRLGIEPQAARRGALTHLAATMPAAVLARVLDLAPGTAVRWVGTAGGDWNRYAADLVGRSLEGPK
jgi:integrase